MPHYASVWVHPSQWPDQVWADLCLSLHTRRIQHKFHYESYKQARKWLALHEAYSPARTDPECHTLYQRAFARAADRSTADRMHLIGLGCGGGQKDVQLLQELRIRHKQTAYTPVDVSLPLILTASQAARALDDRAADGHQDEPLPGILCDLSGTDFAEECFRERAVAGWTRWVTCFGMLPNFEPSQILPRLAGWVGQGGQLLLSANLAPGPDYAAGVEKVLPLYQNQLTEDWLQTLLWDLGFDREDGRLSWTVEECPESGALLRIAAHFHLLKSRSIQVQNETFDFPQGERIQLFFSYRHTPETVRRLLERSSFELIDQLLSRSGEEGVFLFRNVGGER